MAVLFWPPLDGTEHGCHDRVVVDPGLEFQNVVEFEDVDAIGRRLWRLDLDERLAIDVFGNEYENAMALTLLAIP